MSDQESTLKLANSPARAATRISSRRDLIYDVVMLLLLVAGAVLRLSGIDWASENYLHPDERHLVNVETALSTVKTFGEYWDTANSTLNPHNVGYNFFVYGTLPIFLVRYVSEWLGQIGYSEMMIIGRQLSAIADLFVVLLVYLTASRAFDRRVGLAAGAFSTFTVLQIQISHFFAVDTYLTLFSMLAVYLAVRLATEENPDRGPVFKPWLFVLFGIALGMAVASKINTVPVALVLPLAVWVRISRLDRGEQFDAAWHASGYLIVAALVSLVTFRIFQPYAFSGPGFLGVIPNPKWVDNIRELMRQTNGDFDWPPSIQWARRPLWFSFQNMVLWGMGVPMSVMAWGGFLVAGWQMLKGRWRQFLVMWVWTAFYFGWQSMAFNPTMRYQILVYPVLAIFAGWAVVSLCDWAGKAARAKRIWQIGAAVVGVGSILLTAWWAVAFAGIYTRPITRVAASDWIFHNVPGPLNLQIETEEGVYSQPLPLPYGQIIAYQTAYTTSFMPKQNGLLRQVAYKDVFTGGGEQVVAVTLSEAGGVGLPVYAQSQQAAFDTPDGLLELAFIDENKAILPGDRYYVLEIGLFSGDTPVRLETGSLRLEGVSGTMRLPLTQEPVELQAGGNVHSYSFTTVETVSLLDVSLTLTQGESSLPDEQVFRILLDTDPEFSRPTVSAPVAISGLADGVSREGGIFELEDSLLLESGTLYHLRIENLTEGGSATFQGATLANEGSWDDGLPMPTGGYNGYGGIYPPDMGFDMYNDANPDKLARFLYLLETSEYLTISSSRQWASTTRIPERYPLNVVYYRNLLGCPEERTIEWCYNVAEPGMFEGNLGFELIRTFQSDPEFAGLRINDQFAEEAFTVYDHPKVFVFKKQAGYDHAAVTEILSQVDFDNVIRLTPKQAGEFKSLLLSEPARARQREAGTWSELFDSDAWYNRSGIGAVALWYLALTVLGWAVFPLVRKALPGLPDNGYPLVRTAGMLLLAYLSWLAGSVGLGYTKPVIAGVFLLLSALGIWQAVVQRDELTRLLRARWREFLRVEVVFLAAFLLVLLVRYGNPDLWHPYKGGEKPMDFAYFNAILKTVSFPAYDPWYAGGYINYYYFGFVFVGTLVKMLGIVPALAYNIILPTLFAMIFTGAYSAAGNLYRKWEADRDHPAQKTIIPAWLVGIAGGLITAFLGNLGTIRMIIEGFQRLAAQGDFSREAAFFTKVGWTFSGFGQLLKGTGLPYGMAEFYWQPSRVIPALNEPEPITEFPWFTTIYADLHAHFMSLALVFLALAWVMAVVFSKAWQGSRRWQVVWSFAFAGVSIGALRPTNTWDLPAYLALGGVAVIFAAFRYGGESPPMRLNAAQWKWGQAIGGSLILMVLTFLLYQPFARWYGMPYSQVMLWRGTHTPISSYFVHWGLFLFILVFWMGWETRQWMAATPLSALRRLEPYRALIYAGGGLILLAMLVMAVWLKVRIHLVAMPLAVWTAVLLFRKGASDSKRMVLFMTGTALFLTMLVEVVVLSGDIGRMNTVFKFYLQAWVLFGASSAAAFGWTLTEMRRWQEGWQSAWRIGLALLALGAFMFPLTATMTKVQDRMSAQAPHTLDGMAFMITSEYPDEGGVVQLDEEYEAIRWAQENITGTPVIVEANTPLYRWGSRFSIYTGLPTVLGWDWHQTQQRGFSQVTRIPGRQEAIRMFYLMDDRTLTEEFLREYQVDYIILGQLERNYYPGVGLDKFERWNGDLWQEVFRNEETVIYEVRDGVLYDRMGE
ncbi:MAG: phospholipid carrier-dependent glycosyltransferase [Anaerolineales bacterium]|nr:phospholipid carrier-dependent glycosyltransferase [Anaerolineales bacterium]